MKKRHYIIISAMLLLTSCGQQHQAEYEVEDFMNEHLKETADLQITSFGKIDSTRHINDSIIISLREATKRSSVYKDDIEYATAGNDSKLIIVRVTYTINGTKHKDTYYLDEKLAHVIAIKSN